MVRVYYNLIKNHRKTIEDVPASLRAKVLALLNEAGLDGNGDRVTNEE